MDKFNVGDKVRVIGNSYDHCFEIGQICVVVEAGHSLEVEGSYIRQDGDTIQQIMHNTDIELVK